MNPEQFIIIPILGILAGIVIPISVFIWQYYDQKRKREVIIDIVKHLNNPSKLDELLTIFDERKKEPIDYRRSGVISIFIGAVLFIFGYYLTPVLKGVGAMVGLIGVGTMIAEYLYPNTEKELTEAVKNMKKIRMGRDHQKLLNNLEEFRKTAKLTQEELSFKAEVSRKSINAIENGVYVPSTVLALKISKTLNCNVEDLFQLPED